MSDDRNFPPGWWDMSAEELEGIHRGLREFYEGKTRPLSKILGELGGTMSEKQVLPPIAEGYQLIHRLMQNELGRGRNNGLANEHAIELIEKYSVLLASLAQSEAERERLQEQLARLREELKSADEHIEALYKKYEGCPHQHPIECACSYDRVTDVCAVHAPRLEATLAELARERERHQQTTSLLMEYMAAYICDTNNLYLRCKALLEPKPAPVATNALDDFARAEHAEGAYEGTPIEPGSDV